eukprot:1188847-Prorocentrum_minimum.AAC.2
MTPYPRGAVLDAEGSLPGGGGGADVSRGAARGAEQEPGSGGGVRWGLGGHALTGGAAGGGGDGGGSGGAHGGVLPRVRQVIK